MSNIKTKTFLANWVDIAHLDHPTDLVIPSLSTFSHDPIYNSNIQIKNNTFQNAPDNPKAAALHILNSSDVRLEGNKFQGFVKPVVVDPSTTRDIQLQDK